MPLYYERINGLVREVNINMNGFQLVAGIISSVFIAYTKPVLALANIEMNTPTYPPVQIKVSNSGGEWRVYDLKVLHKGKLYYLSDDAQSVDNPHPLKLTDFIKQSSGQVKVDYVTGYVDDKHETYTPSQGEITFENFMPNKQLIALQQKGSNGSGVVIEL